MPYDEIELSRAKRRAAVDAALRGLAGDDFKPFQMPEPEPAPEPELSFAAKYVPLAVRGVGGFIGSAPGIGALGSGGAEIAAEGLENYFGTREGLSPWEIGGAAALGAVGGGMVKAIGSAPSALSAAARAGALGATQPFIRSYTEKGELPEAKDVALSTILSGATGGALGHFLGAGRGAQAAKGAEHTVELTGSKGAGTIERKITGTGEPINAVTDMEQGAGRGYSRAGYAETEEQLAQHPKVKRQAAAEQRASDQAAAREKKLADEAIAAQEIENAKAQGLVPYDTVSESMSAPIPGGTERLNRRYGPPPEAEAEEGAEGLAGVLGGKKAKGGTVKAKATKAAQAPSTLAQVLAPKAAEAASDLGERAAMNAADVIPPAGADQVLSSPNAIPVTPQDLQNSFGPGAQFSTAPQSPDDLLGALQGLAERKSGVRPEALPETGLAPEPQKAVPGVRGQAAQVIEDLPADITQRPGYTPGPPLKGGGGQLAKMTEASAGPDRFGDYLRSTGREELDLAAERAKMPETFGTIPSGPTSESANLFRNAVNMAEGGPNLLHPPAPVQALEEVPQGVEQTIPMEQVGRGQLPVASQHYNALQKLFKAGEGGVPKIAPRTAGRALQRIGREAEQAAPNAAEMDPTLPVVAPKPGPVGGPAPAGPQFGANASDSLKDFFRNLAREGPRPGRPGGIGPSLGGGSGWGSQGGFATPSFLTHLGGAVAGGLVGGVANQDDPIMGALGGAAAGAALTAAAFKIAPHLPDIMASPTLDAGTKQVLSQLGTPEGMKQAAVEIVNRIPTTLRANLLYSLNLPNNAIVGPYGAALAAATERHLAGDPRAAEFLKLLTPSNWGSAFRESLDEASRHIGEAERAGGHLAGAATNFYDKYTAFPGTLMHAGDLATRKLGMLAGFSEAEMKAFTMTAEPEFGVLRQLANIPRTGLAGQVIAPFVRTAANAVEQGSFRTPGLGYLMQALRENPDAMNVQHVQQLLGAGVMAGGYEAGQHEDEIAKSLGLPPQVVRAFVRNVVGPYSTLASAGYATGKALDSGDTGKKAAFKGAGAYINETPLPTLNILRDYLGFAQDPGIKTLPAGIAPKGIIDYLNPEKAKGRPQRPKANRPKRPTE